MRSKNALKKLGPLLKAPSFTSKEAAKRGITSATLSYYVKSGALDRLGHGVYRSKDAPKTSDFRFEDLAETAMKVKGGIICLTSALALYGLTEEIPRQHWIAIRNDTIHRASPSTKIVRMRNLRLGVSTIDVGGISLRVFDRERTIVDAFRYLGQETAMKALKAGLKERGAGKLDIEKIKKYAKTLHVSITPYLLAMSV